MCIEHTVTSFEHFILNVPSAFQYLIDNTNFQNTNASNESEIERLKKKIGQMTTIINEHVDELGQLRNKAFLFASTPLWNFIRIASSSVPFNSTSTLMTAELTENARKVFAATIISMVNDIVIEFFIRKTQRIN